MKYRNFAMEYGNITTVENLIIFTSLFHSQHSIFGTRHSKILSEKEMNGSKEERTSILQACIQIIKQQQADGATSDTKVNKIYNAREKIEHVLFGTNASSSSHA